ncbi:signal peptidase II [Fodinibius sediminis]|uniref:Lipoprotein signal peptidase n=1 Tax=Fodinibius sediminis TaxID=1214077 RepID=A0A521FGA0_9BACT|nr:signal peptidase II [Fodinibius sediminis]SMO95217.1 signal peptidase II [Fodinibius sediminis]
MNNNKLWFLFAPVLLVALIDQLTKQLVRTTPSLQNLEIIPGWLVFAYTQNPGMALGIDWFPTWAISLISIVAVAGIFIYVARNLSQATPGYLICMGLILGGALGNIIDRLIMAKIEGYGHILEGRVNDFLYFTYSINRDPVFPYIFNMADVFISTSIILLLVFNRRLLPEPANPETAQSA